METILDRVRAAQANVGTVIPKRANVEANRYAWHPLMNISHPDVMAINGGEMMPRLKWQPITRAPRWDPILSRPGEKWVATRPAPPEKPREGMYWIMPMRIAESLQTLYAESGLLVSPNLEGVELDTFARLFLDDIFFPEDDSNLPGTFKACDARIKAQLAKLAEGKAESPSGGPLPVAPELIPHVVEIGKEMGKSLVRSANYLSRYIDERHAEMEKAKTDNTGRYRGHYDARERTILAWLEIAPRDQAINRLAQDHNNMGDTVAKAVKESMTATAEMMKASQVDVNALGAAIGKSLAESLGPLIKGNVAQAPQPQTGQNKPK